MASNAFNSLTKAMQQSDVLNKTEDDSAVVASMRAETAKVTEAQTKAIDDSVAYEKASEPVKIRLTSEERAYDVVDAQLSILEKTDIGSQKAVAAWAKIVDTLSRHAKKNTLDNILFFFRVHRKDEFLQEQNALQGTETLSRSVNIRVRLLYSAMRSLSSNSASKETLNVGVIRNIFKNDDLTNWIAVQMSERR